MARDFEGFEADIFNFDFSNIEGSASADAAKETAIDATPFTLLSLSFEGLFSDNQEASSPSTPLFDGVEELQSFYSPLDVQTEGRSTQSAGIVYDQLAIVQDTESDAVLFDSSSHEPTVCCCLACASGRGDDTTWAFDSNTGGTVDDPVSAGAVATLSEMADFLQFGYWNSEVGRYHNLGSTGFDPNNGVLYYNVTSAVGIFYTDDPDGISAERADLVREAFKVYGEVLGIEFIETTSTDTSVVDFFFTDNASGAYAGSSAWSNGEINYSVINLATSWSGGTSTYNDYTLQTIFHEIGHALGLGHQGPYNGSASYATDAIYELDSWQASMMSYFSQNENTVITADYEFLQTPMTVDWIALNNIYGVYGYGTDNAFTGDTIYGFGTNITSAESDIWAQYASYANVTASTIIDAGGIDTLNFSGYSGDSYIDLTVQTADQTYQDTSNIGGRVGNLTLGIGTVIENAIGGSGNDTFIGNAANNTFTGNAGNDTFFGFGGNDTFIGGIGTDVVNFTMDVVNYTIEVYFDYLNVIGEGIDQVYNDIETFIFNGVSYTYAEIEAFGGTGNVAPDAVNDGATVAENGVVSNLNILGNDTDTENDPLTVIQINGQNVSAGGSVTLASGAVVTLNADGTVDYDTNGAFDSLNDGENGADSFTYRISDGNGGTDTATVNITVTGITQQVPPQASGDSATVDEGAVLANFDVLANDSDGNNDPLTITHINGTAVSAGGSVTLASGAVVTLNADGTVDYDQNGVFDALNDGENGADSFTYTISDGNGGSDTATANITITGQSPAPVVTPITIDFEGVSTGNFPGEGGLLFSGVSVIQNTALGGSQLGQSSSFTIDASGEDFDLNGMTLRSAGGRVRVRIEAYDDGVLVGSANYNTRTNRITDANFDATFDSIDQLVVTANGTFYIDDIDVITYQGGVTGGNNAPTATDDSFSTSEDAAIGGNLLADNGGGADSDPDGDPLTVVSVQGDTSGSVTLSSGAVVTFSSDGTFSYDPNGAYDYLGDGQSETDSFTYTISDGQGGMDSATVNVVVNGVGTPVTPPATYVVGFEGGLVEDGFDFSSTAQITTRAKGVSEGSQAAQSLGDSMTITRDNNGDFDFESMVITADSVRSTTATIQAYQDGVLVGTQNVSIRSSKETSVNLNDATFDNVDQVVITATGGVIVDELVFVY